MNLNRATIIGRLGKDPELAYTPSGKAVTKFSVATSENWVDKDKNRQEKVTWHNVIAWGKAAEVIKEFCVKGNLIYIEGSIDNRSYDDKDGTKKYISEIIVKVFQFGPRTNNAEDQGEDKQRADNNGSNNDGEEDLPF